MKHLLIMAAGVLLLGSPIRAFAYDTKDVADIEAEDMAAEAEGSQLSEGFLDQQKEQAKIDTRMDESRAQKVVEDSQHQQAVSEAMINKAETEIAQLKKQQAAAIARQQKAVAEKKVAIAKLKLTIKQLKYYRARAKQAQSLAMKEERGVASVKSRTAKLQSVILTYKPVQTTSQRPMRPARVSPAEVATSR